MDADLKARYDFYRREYHSPRHGVSRTVALWAYGNARTEQEAERQGIRAQWVYDDIPGDVDDDLFACECADPWCQWRPRTRHDSPERKRQIDRILEMYVVLGCIAYRCVDDCPAEVDAAFPLRYEDAVKDHRRCEELAAVWGFDFLAPRGQTIQQERDERRVLAVDVLREAIDELAEYRRRVDVLAAMLAE